MADRLTEERVRDIARDCFVAMVTLGEVEEIARRVLELEAKLAEAVAIAREAVDAMTELLTGEVPAPDLDDLRARLAQVGGKP